MNSDIEEFTPEGPSTELVHWMAPGRFRVGPGGLAAAVTAAFAIGLAVGLGGVTAYRWLVPRREGLPPWRWGRGPLH